MPATGGGRAVLELSADALALDERLRITGAVAGDMVAAGSSG